MQDDRISVPATPLRIINRTGTARRHCLLPQSDNKADGGYQNRKDCAPKNDFISSFPALGFIYFTTQFLSNVFVCEHILITRLHMGFALLKKLCTLFPSGGVGATFTPLILALPQFYGQDLFEQLIITFLCLHSSSLQCHISPAQQRAAISIGLLIKLLYFSPRFHASILQHSLPLSTKNRPSKIKNFLFFFLTISVHGFQNSAPHQLRKIRAQAQEFLNRLS